MRNIHFTSLAVATAVLFVGCSADKPTADVPAKNEAASAPATLDRDALLAKLAAADQLDGTEDKVVSKCYLCGLGMDGSAEYAAEYEGYTVHLCSDHCLEEFQKDPAGTIAQADVPTP